MVEPFGERYASDKETKDGEFQGESMHSCARACIQCKCLRVCIRMSVVSCYVSKSNSFYCVAVCSYSYTWVFIRFVYLCIVYRYMYMKDRGCND